MPPVTVAVAVAHKGAVPVRVDSAWCEVARREAFPGRVPRLRMRLPPEVGRAWLSGLLSLEQLSLESTRMRMAGSTTHPTTPLAFLPRSVMNEDGEKDEE
jgi:hypothetical protein